MIYCTIEGDRVYPSLSQGIKITRENPELKDKGSYTLDVTFPMSIYENQLKFRHLNRIDVSLQRNDYMGVTLFVDRLPVISGIGVVTSVNNQEVKLQIMNANSEFKYASGFDKRYIDEMFQWWNSPGLLGGRLLPGTPPHRGADQLLRVVYADNHQLYRGNQGSATRRRCFGWHLHASL